jgi:hypothetical protein
MNALPAVLFGIVMVLMTPTANAQKWVQDRQKGLVRSAVSPSPSVHGPEQRRCSLSAAWRSGSGRVFRRRTT